MIICKPSTHASRVSVSEANISKLFRPRECRIEKAIPSYEQSQIDVTMRLIWLEYLLLFDRARTKCFDPCVCFKTRSNFAIFEKIWKQSGMNSNEKKQRKRANLTVSGRVLQDFLRDIVAKNIDFGWKVEEIFVPRPIAVECTKCGSFLQSVQEYVARCCHDANESIDCDTDSFFSSQF